MINQEHPAKINAKCSEKCLGRFWSRQVQAAIDADDEKLLVKLLQDFKGICGALDFDCFRFLQRFQFADHGEKQGLWTSHRQEIQSW